MYTALTTVSREEETKTRKRTAHYISLFHLCLWDEQDVHNLTHKNERIFAKLEPIATRSQGKNKNTIMRKNAMSKTCKVIFLIT